MSPVRITVEKTMRASPARVWQALREPSEITQWNSGHPDWHTPRAENDLRPGGRFCYRMEAKDGRQGFDLAGTYTEVTPERGFTYTMEDGRTVRLELIPSGEAVTVRETFQAEDTLSAEQQRQGWQNILDNLARHVEADPA